MTAATPATAAGVQAPEVTLLRGAVFERLGNARQHLPSGRPAQWLLVVDQYVVALSEHDMPSGVACQWAETWLWDQRGLPVRAVFCVDDVDDGEWAIDVLMPEPAGQSKTRRRWPWGRGNKTAAVVAEPEPAPVETPAAPVPPDPAPTAVAASPPLELGPRWPRFVTERPPSMLEQLAYARRGAWTVAEPGAPSRWWHVAYAYSVGVPVLAVAAVLGWAAVKPARLATVAGLAAVVATALDMVPGVGWLVPDALTVTFWWGVVT